MSEADLEQQYKGYLTAINERRFEDLDQFVAEQAVFNGNIFNPKEYGDFVASVSNACENGLNFTLIDLLIDAGKGRLASKLVVTGKPTKDFFGYRPNGSSVRFNESAFYYFENGKIVRVDTIVDRGDIHESLGTK